MLIKTFYNFALITCLYLLTSLIVASLFLEPNPVFLPHVVYVAIVFSAVITLSRYFLYTILGLYCGVTQIKNRQQIASYHPLVSVIIPAWNAEVGILPTIKSVLSNEYRNLEIPFLIVLIIYGIASRDFMPLFSSIVILASITSLQIMSSESGWNRVLLILLAPVSWWLLLIITGIEITALIRALWSMRGSQTLQWQRVGLAASHLK